VDASGSSKTSGQGFTEAEQTRAHCPSQVIGFLRQQESRAVGSVCTRLQGKKSKAVWRVDLSPGMAHTGSDHVVLCSGRVFCKCDTATGYPSRKDQEPTPTSQGKQFQEGQKAPYEKQLSDVGFSNTTW
jgi:hypothetical protein